MGNFSEQDFMEALEKDILNWQFIKESISKIVLLDNNNIKLVKEKVKKLGKTSEFNKIFNEELDKQTKILKDKKENKKTSSDLQLYVLSEDTKNKFEEKYKFSLNDFNFSNYIVGDIGIKKPVTKNGLPVQDKDTKEFVYQVICRNVVVPVGIYFDYEDSKQYVKIASFDNLKKVWVDKIYPAETLAHPMKMLNLLSDGIAEITSENAKDMIVYISDVKSLNQSLFERKKAINKLGFQDNFKTFLPYDIKDSKYVYFGDQSGKSIFAGIEQKGDYNGWKEKNIDFRRNSKKYCIMQATAFASPLLNIVGINPFIVHFQGNSGSYKSVSLKIQMSIYGNPSNLFFNWQSSLFAIYDIMNTLQNLPFALDERQALNNRLSDFNKLIMCMCEGKEGDKAEVSDGKYVRRKPRTWSLIVMSTGEDPIKDQNGKISKNGVEGRVINIEDDDYYIDKTNPDNDGARLVGEKVGYFCNNYGFAGKEWIEYIIKNKDAIIEEYFKVKNDLKEYINENMKDTTIMDKTINSIALIMLADKLSLNLVYKTNETALEFDDILKYFADSSSEEEKAYNYILDMAKSNINQFQDPTKDETSLDNIRGGIWGTISREDDDFLLSNPANHDNINNPVIAFNFIPTKLNELLNNIGIDWNGIKNKFISKGYINCEYELRDGKAITRATKRIGRVNGVQIRGISIKVPTQDYSDSYEDNTVDKEANNNILPF